MGGMQIMLDKGEENDWLASNFIRVFALLFAAGMIGLIWREWQSKNPIMNLKLFKFKNFAICALPDVVGRRSLSTQAPCCYRNSPSRLLGYTATVGRRGANLGGLVTSGSQCRCQESPAASILLEILPSVASPSLPWPSTTAPLTSTCKMRFRHCFLAALVAGGSIPILFYRDNKRGLHGPAKRSQQSDLGNHQLRDEILEAASSFQLRQPLSKIVPCFTRRVWGLT